MALLTVLHVIAAVLWVGGMAFAYGILRPAAGALEPPARLVLWRDVFSRFFPVVWGSVGTLLVTGYWLIFGFMGGFGGAGLHVHVMNATGLLMMALFAHLFFAPWKRFRLAVGKSDWQAAAGHLGSIRTVVAINLALGLLTVAVAVGGRYW